VKRERQKDRKRLVNEADTLAAVKLSSFGLKDIVDFKNRSVLMLVAKATLEPRYHSLGEQPGVL
jgi:hypothetical protein